ncbi:be581865-7688-4b94-9ad9-d4fbc19cf3a3 [Sclerotinia trifoliorum]|uniref:Be581865-7688-4b94-9ad9-d4fbc19cf3a3 n=1 Tax=Sclerotinia trifoliorum TaxID=28548 RepID=A0A8H2ZN75_9HELO|nr:be581865-7688-4b94-9ad9-d4fbc19cf3a3 [Sclerotinia trifoliorum]
MVASVYITLQYIVQAFGSEKSRIPARSYTWVFTSFDILSLLLQVIGGGIAASAGDNHSTRDLGTNPMIAGIVWQVFTLIVFAALVLDYIIRTRRSWDRVPEDKRIMAVRRPFKLFCVGVTVPFITIFARCVYRIAEMVGSWANPIMREKLDLLLWTVL